MEVTVSTREGDEEVQKKRSDGRRQRGGAGGVFFVETKAMLACVAAAGTLLSMIVY